MIWIDLLWPLGFAAAALALLPAARWPGLVGGPRRDRAWAWVGLALLPGVAYFALQWGAGLITEDELSSLRPFDDPALFFLVSDKGLPSRLHRVLELAANQTVGLGLVRAVHLALLLGAGGLLAQTALRRAGGLGLALVVWLLAQGEVLALFWESRAHAGVTALGMVGACCMARATVAARPGPWLAGAFAALALAALDNPITLAGLAAMGVVVLGTGWGSRVERGRMLGAWVLLGVGLLATILPAMGNHGTRLDPTPWTARLWLPWEVLGVGGGHWILVGLAALVRGPRGRLARIAVVGMLLLAVPVVMGLLPPEPKVGTWWRAWCLLAVLVALPAPLRGLPAWTVLFIVPVLGIYRYLPGWPDVQQEAREARHLMATAPPGTHLMPEFARTRLVSAVVDTHWARGPDFWDHAPPAWARTEHDQLVCPEAGTLLVDARYQLCLDCPLVVDGDFWLLRRCGG